MRPPPVLRLLASVLLLWPSPGLAQEDEVREELPAEQPRVGVSMAVDFTSRFIYRGLDLGDSPQIQPRISLHAGGLELSLWASHPISPAADDEDNNPRRNVPEIYREVLLWARYDLDLGRATLSPYVQNHYNPNAGALFDFDGGGEGAHVLQAQLFLVGDADWIPLDVMAGWAFYNDPHHSVYLEGGYRFQASGLAMRAFAGGTPAASPFNGTDEAALTVLGLSARRTIVVTPAFSLPIAVSFVVNPYTEKPFAAFSVSL